MAILLALKCPDARVDATDLSADALAVATINRAHYGLEERLQFFQGDLLSPLEPHAYSLIITNPPYVDHAAMQSLPPEYHCEPTLALESGMDGLDHVRRILHQAARYLTPDGWLVVEVGHQAERLERAFPTSSLYLARPRIGRSARFCPSLRGAEGRVTPCPPGDDERAWSVTTVPMPAQSSK